jgi:hypothetical protein
MHDLNVLFCLLEYKTDQKNLEKEISSLRDTIKKKTTELEKLETGEIKKMKGFELGGITANDLYNITGVNKEFDE